MKKLNTMKTMSKKVQKGFTLIELMIVIAIIGILASVAIPQYQQYTRTANAQTIVTQANSYQTAISLCAQLNGGTLTGCNAGTNNIPAVSNEVTGITNGVITINFGDIDGDGTAEAVTVNPFVAAASVVWGVYSSAGTDVCLAANDWLDCNQTAFTDAGGTAPGSGSGSGG